MSISISGIDTVFANLDKAATTIADRTGDAIQGAGIDTEAGAKQRAPVDTGRFRAGYKYTKTSATSCTVGNPVFYGPFLEFGTTKMAPRPSLFPAYGEAKATLKEELAAIPGVTVESWG